MAWQRHPWSSPLPGEEAHSLLHLPSTPPAHGAERALGRGEHLPRAAANLTCGRAFLRSQLPREGSRAGVWDTFRTLFIHLEVFNSGIFFVLYFPVLLKNSSGTECLFFFSLADETQTDDQWRSSAWLSDLPSHSSKHSLQPKFCKQ